MQQHEHWRALLLRTEATANAYHRVKEMSAPGDGCRLCNDTETIQEYTHWRLVPNRFPYDRYFSKSDMLITKRHTNERGLREEERTELLTIKSGPLTEQYDLMFENLPKQRSIPHHLHYHLVEIKRPEDDQR